MPISRKTNSISTIPSTTPQTSLSKPSGLAGRIAATQDSVSGIYLVLNTVNYKLFVKGAYDLNKDTNDCLTQLRSSKHSNRHLQNAWNKYGESFFRVHILEQCSANECIDMERHWIEYLETRKYGYNR